MQRYHQELQEQSARILQLPDMQIPLFSRISMPEISDTRLHRDLVDLMHMVRFFLDLMLLSMTFQEDVMLKKFTVWQ